MTRVALLWHMHQPFYQDLVTGEHVMPWVRLHALKDYWGMVALLREFPDVRVTFNLVPSLLVQIEAFATNKARDRHLEIGLKPAADLSPEERLFCFDQFFHAQPDRMIRPHHRYAELLARREDVRARGPAGSPVTAFTTNELRDLQVWHKLAWIDPLCVDSDPRVRGLIDKGREYDEQDKRVLRSVELELLGRVIPEYRDAAERGQIELSTSPFYHPILPLLCDTDVYHRTHPDSPMPREPFRHPEDATLQLRRAIDCHERIFGHKPKGVWPSEGSVSDAMVPLVADVGLAWMATDEAIFERTTGKRLTRDAAGLLEQPEALYRPYLVGEAGQQVACGFRDHVLSDLIGFAYAAWPADMAADDFVTRLAKTGRAFRDRTGGEDATIFVILDGENAWEHFEGQGRRFLRALYARLSDHPDLRTVTMGEACAKASAPLPRIFPGSWINGDFYIWIGHRDDHRAWTQLGEARRALGMPRPGVAPDALVRAQEELLIAEGSDWFWWYGDDHSSEHDAAFDDLFRRHLRNVYQALGMPIPDDLWVSNISTADASRASLEAPTGLLHPQIDGEVSSYFEWLDAGSVVLTEVAGAMHQVSQRPRPTRILFGFDASRSLAVRLDAAGSMAELLGESFELTLVFLAPASAAVTVRRRDGHVHASLRVRAEDGWSERPCPGLHAAVGDIAELLVPTLELGLTAGSGRFFVSLARNGGETERYPHERPVEFHIPRSTRTRD